jgi:hypothetical protein
VTTIRDQERLDTLACEIGVRPADAPQITDIIGAVRATTRAQDSLTVRFDTSAADAVAGFVAAEQLCCRDIHWDLIREPELTLRITAWPAALDVLEEMLAEAPTSETSATSS